VNTVTAGQLCSAVVAVLASIKHIMKPSLQALGELKA